MTPRGKERVTAVLDARLMLRGSEKAVVEARLRRRRGVLEVEANPVSQTASVTYDPSITSLEELRGRLEESGLHCAGQSVPAHVCDPLEEPDSLVSGAMVVEPGPRATATLQEAALRSPARSSFRARCGRTRRHRRHPGGHHRARAAAVCRRRGALV